VNFGLTLEQMKKLTEAAVNEQLTAQFAAQIGAVSRKLAVTEDATKTFLRIVGKQDVPLERLPETLNRFANDYKRLQVQTMTLMSMALGGNDKASQALLRIISERPDIPNDRLAITINDLINNYRKVQRLLAEISIEGSTGQTLLEQARVALSNGEFERSGDLLGQAEELELATAEEARRLARQAEAKARERMLLAARATSARADLALKELNYSEAARLFGKAASLVPDGEQEERDSLLRRKTEAALMSERWQAEG
jgi:hypothetical protein